MIKTATEGAVRIVILNDPESMNSLSEVLAKALFHALTDAKDDPAVTSIVLTADGDTFCAGGNLKDFQSITGDRGKYVGDIMEATYTPLALKLHMFPKPVVVAVNGPAIGAGVALALNCDVTLCSTNAWFSLPFVPSLGIVPDFGCGWLLAQAIGYRRALHFSLSGEKMQADDAWQSGLVAEVCELASLRSLALSLAEKLGNLPVHARQRTRDLLRASQPMALEDYLAVEHSYQVASFGEGALDEGLAAFLERRRPDFSGII